MKTLVLTPSQMIYLNEIMKEEVKILETLWEVEHDNMDKEDRELVLKRIILAKQMFSQIQKKI